jgi:hypothetical protein
MGRGRVLTLGWCTAAAVVALATIPACGSGDTSDRSTTTVVADECVGGGAEVRGWRRGRHNVPASPITQGIYVYAATDAPDGNVVTASKYDLEEMATYPQVRAKVVRALAAEPAAVLANVIGDGDVVVEGRLPDTINRGLCISCYPHDVLFLEVDGDVLVHVLPGVCGMEDSELGFEFGADGVEIADRRFILDPPDRSAPGTVAVDRPASRGYADGDTATVVLEPVPEDEIAPPTTTNLVEWPPLRPFVCFDVTVRAGGDRSSGAAAQVQPTVVISQGGEPIPVPEPTDLFEPRPTSQEVGSTALWSFGPTDLAEHQPDEITVTATEGEIASWDVSARHC